MEEAGELSSSWGESENNRRAKFYRLTAAGRRQLRDRNAAVGNHRARHRQRAAGDLTQAMSFLSRLASLGLNLFMRQRT